MEQWRDIPGYEGIYQASNMGNIRTCEGKTTYTEWHGPRMWKSRVLKQKQHPNAKGRCDARVSLWKDGKESTWLVARLVGMTWCDGYDENLTVNHINGYTLDNRAVNLEWVTRSENIKLGHDTGLYSSNYEPIMLKCGDAEITFNSMADACRFLGRNRGYINTCLKRNTPISDKSKNVYNIFFLKDVSS